MKIKYLITEISTYLLSLLFVITAASKFADLHKFAKQINNQPFDNSFSPALTYGVPTLELVLAVGLLWPATRLIALYGTAALLTIFTVYIALVTFNFYNRIPCGCAFAFEKLSWPQHLIMNCIFCFLAYLSIYYIKTARHIQN